MRRNNSALLEKFQKARYRIQAASYELGGRDLAGLFNKLDLDGDGTVSFEELKIACRSTLKIGTKILSDEELRAFYLCMDSDGDGDISIQELLDMIGADLPAEEIEKIESRRRLHDKKEEIESEESEEEEVLQHVPNLYLLRKLRVTCKAVLALTRWNSIYLNSRFRGVVFILDAEGSCVNILQKMLSHLLYKVIHGQAETNLWQALMKRADSIRARSSTTIVCPSKDGYIQVVSGIFVHEGSLSEDADIEVKKKSSKLRQFMTRLHQFTSHHKLCLPKVLSYKDIKTCGSSVAWTLAAQRRQRKGLIQDDNIPPQGVTRIRYPFHVGELTKLLLSSTTERHISFSSNMRMSSANNSDGKTIGECINPLKTESKSDFSSTAKHIVQSHRQVITQQSHHADIDAFNKMASKKYITKTDEENLMKRIALNFAQAKAPRLVRATSQNRKSKITNISETSIEDLRRTTFGALGAVTIVKHVDENVDYINQGDIEMYSKENIEKRQKMRNHPEVINALTLFWDIIDHERDRLNRLRFESYVIISLKLQKALSQSFNIKAAFQCAREDWNNDLAGREEYDEHGHLVMSKDAFMDGIFEMADHWCVGTKLNEYLLFLHAVLDTIAQGTLHPDSREGVSRRGQRKLGITFKVLDSISNDLFKHSHEKLALSGSLVPSWIKAVSDDIAKEEDRIMKEKMKSTPRECKTDQPQGCGISKYGREKRTEQQVVISVVTSKALFEKETIQVQKSDKTAHVKKEEKNPEINMNENEGQQHIHKETDSKKNINILSSKVETSKRSTTQQVITKDVDSIGFHDSKLNAEEDNESVGGNNHATKSELHFENATTISSESVSTNIKQKQLDADDNQSFNNQKTHKGLQTMLKQEHQKQSHNEETPIYQNDTTQNNIVMTTDGIAQAPRTRHNRKVRDSNNMKRSTQKRKSPKPKQTHKLGKGKDDEKKLNINEKVQSGLSELHTDAIDSQQCSKHGIKDGHKTSSCKYDTSDAALSLSDREHVKSSVVSNTNSNELFDEASNKRQKSLFGVELRENQPKKLTLTNKKNSLRGAREYHALNKQPVGTRYVNMKQRAATLRASIAAEMGDTSGETNNTKRLNHNLPSPSISNTNLVASAHTNNVVSSPYSIGSMDSYQTALSRQSKSDPQHKNILCNTTYNPNSSNLNRTSDEKKFRSQSGKRSNGIKVIHNRGQSITNETLSKLKRAAMTNSNLLTCAVENSSESNLILNTSGVLHNVVRPGPIADALSPIYHDTSFATLGFKHEVGINNDSTPDEKFGVTMNIPNAMQQWQVRKFNRFTKSRSLRPENVRRRVFRSSSATVKSTQRRLRPLLEKPHATLHVKLSNGSTTNRNNVHEYITTSARTEVQNINVAQRRSSKLSAKREKGRSRF